MKISSSLILTKLYLDNIIRSMIHSYEQTFSCDVESYEILRKHPRLYRGLNVIPIRINDDEVCRGIVYVSSKNKNLSIKFYFLLDNFIRNLKIGIGFLIAFLILGICGGIETGAIPF